MKRLIATVLSSASFISSAFAADLVDKVKADFADYGEKPFVHYVVLELMVHEVNGTVEFFRGCPEDWKDISFENRVALVTGVDIPVDGGRILGPHNCDM